MEHMKLALKSLARLHAISFAYFTNGTDDIKAFSEALKLMIDRHYQPSASPEDRTKAKDKLSASFDNLLNVISGTDGGSSLAKKAKSKFSDRLYNIYKDAHASSSNFSVLCHGFPVQENLRFSFAKEGNMRGKAIDAKLINFHVKNVLTHESIHF